MVVGSDVPFKRVLASGSGHLMTPQFPVTATGRSEAEVPIPFLLPAKTGVSQIGRKSSLPARFRGGCISASCRKLPGYQTGVVQSIPVHGSRGLFRATSGFPVREYPVVPKLDEVPAQLGSLPPGRVSGRGTLIL